MDICPEGHIYIYINSDAQIVDFSELCRLRKRGARHGGELGEPAEERLVRDRRHHLRLGLSNEEGRGRL